MKKHFTRTLAMLLVLAMVLSVFPTFALAADVEVDGSATLLTAAPADGTYGVIFNPGTDGKTGYVLGYDITGGNSASMAVSLTSDGKAIDKLPDGTAIVRFIKNSDGTYYFTLGGKYLAIQDTSEGKEKMVLIDAPESGAKWTIIADQAGAENTFNILNAEYKWNGTSDVYLEQYNGQKFCGYSYKASTPQYFQMQFAATAEDDDGRVGEVEEADALPADGDTVVIYNDYAKAVFGQPTPENAAKANLTGASAIRTDAGIRYEDVSDGGLIFTVHVNGDEYTFQTGSKYLGMTENYQDDSGKTVNDESLILVDAENDYTKWTVSEISGGWLMKNKTASWKGNPVYIEYFDDLFAGYSYNAGSPEIFAMNFYHVEDQYNCGYVVNPSVFLSKTPAPAIGSDCPVEFTVNDLNELNTVTVRYRFDSETAEKTADAAMTGKVGAFTIPAADLEGHSSLTVTVEVEDAMNLSFSCTETVEIRDEPLILSVTPEPNSATGDVVRPEITIHYANVGSDPSFELLVDETAVNGTAADGVYTYVPAADLATGKHTLAFTVTRADGKQAVKNWNFFIGASGETLYFGQVHAHTAEYSDGAGQLEDAYEHAHGVDDMDFLIVTDHSNYFDTTATATTSSYYDLSSLLKTSGGSMTKWEEARATARTYNDKWDDFVCMYGYEMTWSGGPGHTNTFNTYGTVSRNNKALNDKTKYAGMHLYNDLMANADKGLDVDGNEAKITRDGAEVTGVNATKYIPFDASGNAVPVVSQFNHPGKTFGNFDNYAGRTAKRDDILNLIEVGNGEGKVGGSAYFPSYEEYDLCLSMGWHVGPTNNQDNHKGNWGSSNTCRDVVLTDDFSEIGIYRALDARRIYATEDQNLEIYYEMDINGQSYKLGDIASIEDSQQPDQVTIRLTVNEPDFENIGTIQIIGEGAKVVKEVSVSGNSYKGDIVIDHKNADGSLTSGYYYVKIIEADGNIAVTAPIWTSEAVPVNVDASTSAAVAAQGVEETVTAELTNGSESETVLLNGWKITADGDVILEASDLSEELAPGSVKTLTAPFTPKTTDPSATKTYEIVAEFTFTYKGKTQTYTKTLTETSYPPELMTYVGLDRGHTNFYVSGDYAGNEGSFIQICAENGILVEYIDAGQMTKENLAKYKMIVLTVPRKDETTAPTVWTEDELAAIADYAANGGNIINLSKSDRYDYSEKDADGKDTYKYASATISNLVNEAVGAKTRFVRGIVVDNEMKTNEAYRINFNGRELLGDHRFTTGIYVSSNGQYQYYNGTGIVTQPGAEAEVTPLVMPYQSTWIACYKDNFTGSAYVPDYNSDTVMAEKDTFNLVTCETLSGGGFLVCGGACFISNYDLKAGTASNEQYENYGLVMNILNYVKNGDQTYEITPIAEVHNGSVGQEFTVEGTVMSNASDYDKDTAFFDCIYVQDETRGINCFPVSGYYYIGEQVRVHGGVTYYCGEIELNLSNDYNGSIEVISNEIVPIDPKPVTCAEAMRDDNIGNLVKISGVITDIHKTEGVIDYIYVDDGSGEIAALFINNYIQKDYKGLDNAAVGMSVEGVGFGSRDVDEGSGDSHDDSGVSEDQYIKRLRVRSREEIRVYNDPCAKFTDVDRDSWYHEGIDYVLNEGIMVGKTDTIFGPNDSLTREQFVTVLWRMEGEPEPTVQNPFTDVKPGRYSYKAILWAYENGITTGKTATIFDRVGKVNREQLATFLYRYVAYTGCDVSDRADLSAFPDTRTVSAYAKDAMSWAVAVGLIKGVGSHGKAYLSPKSSTTRAQIATVLLRLSQLKLEDRDDLVILYTNDVHCGIQDSKNDSGAYAGKSFGYDGLAAYKAYMQTLHDAVGLVDAGDFIQGEAIGSLTKGSAIIGLMNEVGYEAATLGNHEFDYGVDNIGALVEQADFDVVTANWRYTGPAGAADAVDLDAYTVVEYGDLRIAYVGITTPESLVKSTPTYFQDAEGNWIYDFCNDASGASLYEAVQTAVDAARAEGVDYVVALAHLGTDESSAPWRSVDVIANTTGIDAVLDGHSHSVIPMQTVANKNGEDVVLSSTGTKLAYVGKLTITEDGELYTELISAADFPEKDETVTAAIAEVMSDFEELLNTVVVEGLTKDLTVRDLDRNVRAVRWQETNLGDVCADAYVLAGDADIGIVNGGGVRADIPAGDVTYDRIIKVHPFGNELVVVEATGQQIIDALEMSSRAVNYTEDGLLTGECGGFLQVSGLKYTIYTGTPSAVVTDSAGMFTKVDGERRVGSVQVLNKTTGEYEPIDLTKTYKVASHNYMLKQGGDGLNLFMHNTIIRDGGMLDNEVLINYFNSETFTARLNAGIYDNWYGEGRITVSKDAVPADEPEPQPTPEAKGAYVLTTTVSDGDQIVIYHPAQGMSLSTTLNGVKVDGVAVTVADKVLTPAETTAVYTVEFHEGDETNFYLKMADGTYLTSAPTGNGMSFEAEPNEYSLWYLQILDEAAGTVGVRSTNAAYNGNKNQALEYYKGYTTYGWKDNNAAYIFQIYGFVPCTFNLTTAVAADDEIVIYHPAQGMSLSTTLNGVKVDGVAVTVADKVLTPAETTAVYTVEFPEGDETNFYLKMADGTYLTSVPTGNGMSFEAEPNEYSLWYLQILDEAAGTVGVRSTNAAYNGNKNQALEYYKGYTTYGWKDNNAAYVFQIYKFGLPVTNAEVVKTSLEAAITAAEALDLTAYTDESVANLQTALAAAREVLANEAATQEEVNAATASLNAAVEALVLKPIEASFTLASTLQTGDEVLLINPTNAKALDASMNGSYYLNGVDAMITGTTATVASDTAIWTVTVNADGTYTFRNGENVLAAYTSGNYANLALTEADHTVNWVATASGDVFYLNAKDLSTSNGSIYLEWYNGRFSAYASSSPSAAAFGIQFFVKQ